jgi:hypothetical protein
MLYLRTLKVYLKSRPLLSFFYFVSSCLFFGSILFQANVKTLVNKSLFPEEGKYFHMIIKGQSDYSFLKDKLVDLPGVDKVNIVDASVLGKRTAEVIKELALDLPDGIKKFKYTGLTVYMGKDLGSRNLALLKEYVSRIVGKGNLTTTSSVSNNKSKEVSSFKATIKKAPQFYLIIPFAIVWNLLFFLFVSGYKQFASVYERYQRKSGVAFLGTFTFSMIPLMLTFTGSLFITQVVAYEFLVTFLLLFAITYFSTRKKIWSN